MRLSLHVVSPLVALLLVPATLLSQGAAPTRSAPLPDATQIALAVLPLPAEFRANANVLGYHADSPALVSLRKGSGPFNCLASNPALPTFHAACYHSSLEPFMARGRSLRAEGVKGDQVDSARFREVRSGRLKMPARPAALYTLSGPATSVDAASGTVSGARPLYVVYIPGATVASTGITATPAEGTPWIMYPGTPKAHIMFVPKM